MNGIIVKICKTFLLYKKIELKKVFNNKYTQ